MQIVPRKMNSLPKSSQLLIGIGISAITSLSNAFALLPPPSYSQTPTVPQPSQAPLELSLLQGANPDGRVITSNTISQQGLTVPSLWWAKEQFGGNVLSNWLAYPAQGETTGRIDLLVNRQNWTSLDYIGRYEFVNRFGTVARDYGYNIRVFNEQEELLASYTCDFRQNPTQCNMQLDATGKARVRGSSEGLGAGG
jgi:hypothetical protein